MTGNRAGLAGPLLVAAILLFAATAPGWAAKCTAEHAHYVQAGGGEFTAGFARAGKYGTAASDLFFVVRSKSHAYWFRFNVANGYGGISIEPISNPASSRPEEGPLPLLPEGDDRPPIAFIPYTAGLRALDNPPQAGEAPPPVIVLPDLGSVLWYDAAALGSKKERELMSRSAFRLAGCDRKARLRD